MSNTEVILVIVGQTEPQATPKTGNGTDLRSRCSLCRVLRCYPPYRHVDGLQVHIHEARLNASRDRRAKVIDIDGHASRLQGLGKQQTVKHLAAASRLGERGIVDGHELRLSARQSALHVRDHVAGAIRVLRAYRRRIRAQRAEVQVQAWAALRAALLQCFWAESFESE